MSIHPFRRVRPPISPLARACPEYAEAVEVWERTIASADDRGQEAAWAEVVRVRNIFMAGFETGCAAKDRGLA